MSMHFSGKAQVVLGVWRLYFFGGPFDGEVSTYSGALPEFLKLWHCDCEEKVGGRCPVYPLSEIHGANPDSLTVPIPDQAALYRLRDSNPEQAIANYEVAPPLTERDESKTPDVLHA